MTDASRQVMLLERLMDDGQASVSSLARDLGVTPSTIRRDLGRLARAGRVIRTYGGARAVDARPTDAADGKLAAKRAIARAAAEFVDDGSTIVIGSGSTALELARRLVDRRMTVITNALDVATVLVDRPGIELIVLGGVVRRGMHSMLGHLVDLAARELRADTLFMGIGAISLEHGLMNDSVPEILSDRAIRRMARSVVVLADSTKFDQVAPGFVFGFEEIDTIVTDSGIQADTLRALRARGVDVLVASDAAADPAPSLAAARA
ncbi:MAG TPA: DeoR/GlpR family DNA-binding transcription regulator [Candidatus Limnocylindrales bacterium]|jgi:DeoR/GlpR family transcriptional regulator of sugar metabolism|nr:DeoR/GlpR family DNA-binding transcription regulator [Candidatus Limnocylindrales bacterium]